MPVTRISAVIPAGLALALATGCTVTVASPSAEPSSAPSSAPGSSPASAPALKRVAKSTHASAKIVSFKVVQKPRCPEGTDVYRTEGVPLIIKWKITGARSGALSVDDPTGTPGTYGPVALKGTQEFTFSCSGKVGSTETHTYVLYTVGGGKQKHKTLKVSAKVRETGIPVT
ncbi:hypothetical protein AB0J80_06265 [Actinoplanes sp. NPDC049548]|uniref:hypothetical protein n=1 Tax=Actinoplanes sp. NPDC049548 TaxID=3155152 RepID=UPI0034196DE4